MRVKNIKIQNFRNLIDLNVVFSSNISIITGKNAVGKTSILEAINCLSTLKSFRTSNYNDMINSFSDYFFLECCLETEKTIEKVSLYCDNHSKTLKQNNYLHKKFSDYVGFFNVVSFSALDFFKIVGVASERRKMFDLIFCQISKDYLLVSNYYKKLLKDRNTLLKRLSFENRNDLQNLLEVVTDQLIEQGNKMISFRKEHCKIISELSKTKHYRISNEHEEFQLNYQPSVDTLTKQSYNLSYEEDLRKGYTTVGPHIDDYIFIINNKNVAMFGSQGQQRNAIISVKLAMADLIFNIKKEAPTLLLDDVFSELDKNRQNALISSLDSNYQTIITTASISDLDNTILEKAQIVRIEKGEIRYGI